jgi:REP element-mobilizing transposase RayT
MPQSYASLYYHLIFSTRNRLPLLTNDVAQRLYDYIGGIIKQQDGVLIAAGGTEDHIHLLATISRQQAVSDAMRIIKANSSAWIHDAFPSMSDFSWQDGYGVFTVSASNLERVHQYIANQKEHHRRLTYQEEFVRFLKKHDVPYDERYIWD